MRESFSWHLSKMKATPSLLPFEVTVIMLLQLVAEHSVQWLTWLCCLLDPEGEMKAEIQKNLKSEQEEKQSDKCLPQAHINLVENK